MSVKKDVSVKEEIASSYEAAFESLKKTLITSDW
jgi:hypothetical protein